MLAEQAMKNTFSWYNIFLSFEMKISTKLYVFDIIILPIMSYGSEVININIIEDLETNIEIKFCKV